MVIRLGLEGLQPGTLPPLDPAHPWAEPPSNPDTHPKIQLCWGVGRFNPMDLGQLLTCGPWAASFLISRWQKDAGLFSSQAPKPWDPTVLVVGGNPCSGFSPLTGEVSLQILWDLQHSAGVLKGPNTPVPQDVWEITEVEFRCGSTEVSFLPKHLCHCLLFKSGLIPKSAGDTAHGMCFKN